MFTSGLSEANRQLSKDATTAFGAWLSRPSWEWYTTHTFKAECVSPKLSDRNWYSWFNSVRLGARQVGARQGVTKPVWGEGSPFYFRVAEYQDRGTLHYHSLIGGVGDLRRLFYKDLWELFGFARVLAYESGRGANYYVGKYLTKTDCDVRFSHNLTPYLNYQTNLLGEPTQSSFLEMPRTNFTKDKVILGPERMADRSGQTNLFGEPSQSRFLEV